MNKSNNQIIKLMTNVVKISFILLLVYIQIKFIKIQVYGSKNILIYFNSIIVILKMSLVLYIIYNFQSISYKMLWMTLIIFLPIPSFILFIAFGNTKISKTFQKKLDKERVIFNKYIKNNKVEFNEISKLDKLKYNQVNYLYNTNNLPIYKNSGLEYFEIGEEYFESMIVDILKATKYIFLQFYSISEGFMWDKLFNVLKQKKEEGIDIYIITDGFGSFGILPKNFKYELNKLGIKYYIFNSSFMNLNEYINYRSHRKITVIDGQITYSGGINIGDEYINLDKKFGHWKDTGIKIIGEASISYIIMFIQIWNLCGKKEKLEYKRFMPNDLKTQDSYEGYIMPYFDGPDNSSNPAQNLYIQLINSSKNYLYITTPYLVLDSDVVTAFVNSAKSGVDIRIIIPYIPDKPLAHFAAKSFYQTLLEAGVKIYEYKPGFIHSKVFVSDDEIATVGSINLDFRGLYFHFECGNWIYKTGIETTIRDDFLSTQEKSIQIHLEEWRKRGIIKRICDKIIITISPLI